MKTWLAILAFLPVLCGPALADDGDSYEPPCAQLATGYLDGKYVSVNSVDGAERNSTHGYVVGVSSRWLLIDLGGYRSFVNCAHIQSIVVAEKAAEGKEAPAPPKPSP